MEATAGNTGVALAIFTAAARFGARPENAGELVVAMLPDTERSRLSRIHDEALLQV